MAKVAFTKLGLKVNTDIKTIDFNEQKIEVKQYLPVSDKLDLIAKVINLSADDNNFANPIKVEVYSTITIIEAYTNITFTEKQKENITKLYDMISSSGMFNVIAENIPAEELNNLFVGIEDTIEAVYKYRNSLMGIFENITADYSNLNLEATEIQKKLGDPNNMALLRDVLTKLG